MAINVQEYGAKLYQRSGEGKILQWANVRIGDWKPIPNDCHGNVTTVCSNDESFTAIRGWFYFDLNDSMPYVLFVAHSAVLTADGILCDITPATAYRQYPFIAAEESEDDYIKLVVEQNISRIEYIK
jgi:hypothetical protein